MQRILVLYGTTHGHTARIAQTLADTMTAQGADVDVVDAAARYPNPEDYAGIVVAAPIHGGQHQKAVRTWARTHAAVLNAKPTALVTVCLAVLQNEPGVKRELQAIIDRFVAFTGWHPTVSRNVAGALPYTRYNFFVRWMMRRIAAKAGGDTDTTRDYDYTDWKEIRAFAEQFGRIVDPARIRIPKAPIVRAPG